MKKVYDSIIVGGGPAGVSTALYLKSRGLDILLIEKRKIGGLAESVTALTHFVGLKGHEKGEDFGKRLSKNLEEDEVPVLIDEVTALGRGGYFNVKTTLNDYDAKTVVIATGSERMQLDIDGAENFETYARDIKEKTDRIAIVAGGSDGACKEAIYLSELCKEVHLVEIRDGIFCVDQFRKIIESKPNIYFHKSSELIRAEGKPLKSVTIRNNMTGGLDVISGNLVAFSYIGQKPELDFLRGLLPLENGFINSEIETHINGLYVVGDVRVKKVRQIATAVADGALAAPMIAEYIQAEENNLN